MSQVTDMLQQLSENWFLEEPAFFALYCQQQLSENVHMECPLRCGQGRIEYNPLILAHKNYGELEQLMRIELIRLFLKHPYERQPEGCCHEAMSIGSDITIADGYCLLHQEKLPLYTPAFYHLPLGQYYEWYAKAIQNQQDDGRKQNRDSQSSSSSEPQTSDKHSQSQASDNDKSGLWQEDSLQRQRINELIERTTDWGTLPAEVIERIKASTRARIDNRLIWQGFNSAVLSSHRQLTRMRPNRRTGFLQMGSTRQFDTHLLVAIDVSGSITSEKLADFFGSVNRLMRYGITQIDICQFDATLGPIETMQRVRPEVIVKGRGGTDFQPIFDYICKEHHDYDGVLILTDGQAPPPSGKPRIPLLWVCSDRESYSANHNWMLNSGRCCHL